MTVMQVDVVQYYTEETARLEREVELLREESLANPLGMVFITFENIKSSKTVYDDHKSSYLSCFKSKAKHSSLSESLKPSKWKVSFPSIPQDIRWVNLKENSLTHYLLLALFYIGAIGIGLFLTTPEYIAKIALPSILNEIIGENEFYSPIYPLILMIFASLMPSLINWAVRHLHHYKYKSREGYLVLRSTFWYLWVVFIVFPTFNLLTAFGEIYEEVYSAEPFKNVSWECFFNPNTAAIFVTYVISAALVNTGWQLVRLPEDAL